MDEQERLRLQKEYVLFSDEEVLEMLAFNKDEYEEGVYELVLEEAKRRGIDKKKDEIKREPRQKCSQASLNDTAISGAMVQEAIINLLEDKGIATKKEIMEEAKRIREFGGTHT